MRLLPNLGRLALECSTSTKSAKASPSTILPGELLAQVLSSDRHSSSACQNAEAWAATERSARDDPETWLTLIQRVFVRKGIKARTLTEAQVKAGYSPRQWFFELCNRFNMRKAAREHIDSLTRRQIEAAEETERLYARMRAAATEALFSEDVNKRLAFRAADERYDRMRLNMDDPVHPGVPLTDQIVSARLLLAAANRALKADPLDMAARKTLDRCWERVFKPSELPPLLPSTDSENSDDDNDSLDGFIVTNPES